VDWLLLAALGIMWVAFLLPSDRRRQRTEHSVEDFERRMELLAHAEAQGSEGRWIVTPARAHGSWVWQSADGRGCWTPPW
jgi:hypothetical protein